MKNILNNIRMYLKKKLHLFSVGCKFKNKRQILINGISRIIRFFERLSEQLKFRKMVYLKGIFIDQFQKERTQYCLIGYDLTTEQTIMENILIYSNKYTKHTIRRISGDFENDWTKSELSDDYFAESNKKEFNLDIKGKKSEYLIIGGE